jgi:hypothetical protein
MDRIVGRRLFTDGIERDVFEDAAGRRGEAGLVNAFQAHGSGGAAVRRTLLSLPTV